VAAAWAEAACAAAAWEAARAAAVCAALGAVVGVVALPVSELPFADVLFVMTLFEAVLAGLLAGANGLDETAVGASLPSPPPPHPASRSRTAALIWILWFVVDIFNPVFSVLWTANTDKWSVFGEAGGESSGKPPPFIRVLPGRNIH